LFKKIDLGYFHYLVAIEYFQFRLVRVMMLWNNYATGLLKGPTARKKIAKEDVVSFCPVTQQGLLFPGYEQ
jgi:hypothetical protein